MPLKTISTFGKLWYNRVSRISASFFDDFIIWEGYFYANVEHRFCNAVKTERIISIGSDSAPIRRMAGMPENENLVDATSGRRTRAVVIMDSGHIVLSSLQPETLTNRIHDKGD